jgi:hypothetical protein
MQARQQLQRLQSANHEGFLSEAVDYLKAAGETAFGNVVIRLLRDAGNSFDKLLFHPTRLTVPEAAKLVRMVCRAEASFQALIAEQVKLAVERRDFGIPLHDVPRLLDVLAESIDGHRLMPLLTKFSEHSDERLRSKAVLWMGKLAKRGEGTLSISLDPDPRVRANAVEALWGRMDQDAMQVFWKASLDKHHRVSANALYGLYLAGDIGCLRHINRMVESEEQASKLAGIWLVGKTGDPRFLQLIQNTMGVATGAVRSALLKAGRTIKQRKDQLQARPPIRLDLVRSRRGERGEVEIGLLASDPQGAIIPVEDFLATNFVITDGDLKVDSFRAEKRCGSDPVHVVFLLPLGQGAEDQFGRALLEAMERALPAKRRQDLWVIEKYRVEEAELGEEAADGAAVNTKNILNFTAQAEVLRQTQIPSEQAAHESPEVALEGFANRFPLESKRRHIVLLRDPQLRQGLLVNDVWREKLSRQGIALHIINAGAVPAGELRAAGEVCHRLEGFHLPVPDLATLPTAIERVTRALTASLDFSFELGRIVATQPAPKQVVQIECFSSYGYGRLCIDSNGQQTEAPPPPGTSIAV